MIATPADTKVLSDPAEARCSRETKTRATPVAERKPRLLVVDDEKAMCELLALYFEHKGLAVTTAQTAAEGASLIEEGQFDLAILDWKLGGGPDGLDLLNFSHATHPEIPVIMFTGADDKEFFLERQLAGRAVAIMRKMGSLEALSREVFKYLGAKH